MSPILRPCLVLFGVFTVITGILYPFFITIFAQTAFPVQANGSLILDPSNRDRVIGSELIAQASDKPEWFWPRPSAVAWNAAGSGGANLAPVTEPQKKTWAERTNLLRTSGLQGTIPADLVTSSGSGLDPHLSPEAALVQVPRIAAARKIAPEIVQNLVASHIEDRQFGILGAPRVNVLALNLALARIAVGDH